MPSPQELPRTKEQPKLASPEHDTTAIDSDPQHPAIFSAASRRRIQPSARAGFTTCNIRTDASNEFH